MGRAVQCPGATQQFAPEDLAITPIYDKATPHAQLLNQAPLRWLRLSVRLSVCP